MAERANVYEKVMFDMKTKNLNVELKSMSWHLFEKEYHDPGAARTLGPLKVNTISPPFEEHL